jgi:hypothetical protein
MKSGVFAVTRRLLSKADYASLIRPTRSALSVLRLWAELALRLRQGLRLDQQALSLVAAPALAEAHDHGMSGAFRLDPARKQRISGGEELEIAETDAAQARRTLYIRYTLDANDFETYARALPKPVERCGRSG